VIDQTLQTITKRYSPSNHLNVNVMLSKTPFSGKFGAFHVELSTEIKCCC